MATYPIDIVRQATNSSSPYDVAHWDSDGDGCNNAHELSDTINGGLNPNEGGGLRDPENRWDFFDPNHDMVNSSADITAVVQKFGRNEYKKDPANPDVNPPILNSAYNPGMDRTAILGSNSWNLGPPNGLITSEDILAAVKQFHQNCTQTVPS